MHFVMVTLALLFCLDALVDIAVPAQVKATTMALSKQAVGFQHGHQPDKAAV